MVNCPNTWSSPVIFRMFREQISATWTTEEILAVQRQAEAAMLDWPVSAVCRRDGISTKLIVPMIPVAHG